MSSFGFFCFWKFANITELDLRPLFTTCQRHIGPHVDASLLCWQRAVALLPRSRRCFSNLVVWCLSSSFLVFQAFSLYHLYPSVQLVLAVCCRPFAERVRATSVFSLLWWDLYSPVVSVPWPFRYWLYLSMRYPSFFFATCGVQLVASSFVQLLEATILHRITLLLLLLLLLLLWTSLTTRSVVLICLLQTI